MAWTHVKRHGDAGDAKTDEEAQRAEHLEARRERRGKAAGRNEEGRQHEAHAPPAQIADEAPRKGANQLAAKDHSHE